MSKFDDPTLPGAPETIDPPEQKPKGWPLYAWVVLAVVLAVPVGLLLRVDASWYDRLPTPAAVGLEGAIAALDLVPRLIIRALKALAAPLIVLAILSAIVTNDIRGRQGVRMMSYYVFNTTVAMTIGLALILVVRPGAGSDLGGSNVDESAPPRLIDRLIDRPSRPSPPEPKSVSAILTEMVPDSVGAAFASNNIAQLVLLALVLGIGLTIIRDRQRARGDSSHQTVIDLLTVGFELFMRVLLWIIALIPLAVFGIVALSVAWEGFDLFVRLAWFIVVVLLGLFGQLLVYLAEVGVFGRIAPARFLKGSADVMATTFSTASTAATMPVTLKALTERLGVSRVSSQLAACVGTNFNNDGTALYQAVATVFLAQAMGANLGPGALVVVMLTTLVASVGAGGIPSGSFVTLPLIFAAVNLPAELMPLLLTIDWFLDRGRTTINVLGDVTVAILLDRTEPTA
ncbi:dicarboxylate/amino acid:cation symporter [soil metagenome]